MLELRLQILSPYIDHFIIIEADHTFSGQPKTSYFEANKDRFKQFANKITHHVAHIDTTKLDFSRKPDRFDKKTDFWKVEFTQRNAIADALRDFAPDDLAIASDVDEIPSPKAIQRIRQSTARKIIISTVPHIFRQEEFYYNAANLRDEACLGSIITSCRNFIRYTPQKIRDKRKRLPKITNGGYHFSYFMTPDLIAKKISSFSHQEFNTEIYKSESRITNCIHEGRDLFNRPINSTIVGLDHFPPEVSLHLLKFPPFCGPKTESHPKA